MASVEPAAGAGPFLWQRLTIVPSLAIGAGLLALAGISSSAAVANALLRRDPAAAAHLWPVNGFALAGAAAEKAVAGADGAMQAGGFAELALVAEPSSVQAVRSLALSHQAAGDRDRTRQLMRLAARRTRRDTATNLWLVDNHLRAGELDQATALIDATLRTDTRASALLLPRLAQLLSQPAAEELMLGMLQSNPPWGHDFWTAVLRLETIPARAVALRIALHERGAGLAPGHDARLIAELVESRQFAQAFALYAVSREAGGKGSVPFAPIEWRLVSDGKYGALIDPAGAIAIEAFAGAQGVVAQRITALPRGHYTITAPNNGEAGQLALHLSCAEMHGQATFSLNAPLPADGRLSFNQPSPCRYAWLSIELAGIAADRSITVGPLALRRDGGGV